MGGKGAIQVSFFHMALRFHLDTCRYPRFDWGFRDGSGRSLCVLVYQVYLHPNEFFPLFPYFEIHDVLHLFVLGEWFPPSWGYFLDHRDSPGSYIWTASSAIRRVRRCDKETRQHKGGW